MEVAVTPELITTDSLLYIVRADRENICIVNNEKDAKFAVDSLAKAFEKEMTGPHVHVYRRNDGDRVILYEQKLGYVYNSKKVPLHKIDYTPVSIGITMRKKSDKMTQATDVSLSVKNEIAKTTQAVAGAPHKTSFKSYADCLTSNISTETSSLVCKK